MNEEFLRSIYDSKNLGANGATFEDFIKDMQDINFARKIFDSKELGSQGATFDDFITDAGLKPPSPAQEQGGFYNFLGKVPVIGGALQKGVDAVSRGINQGASLSEGVNALTEGGGLDDEEVQAVSKILQQNKTEAEGDNSITAKFMRGESLGLGEWIGLGAEVVVQSGAMMLRGAFDAFTNAKSAAMVSGGAGAGAAAASPLFGIGALPGGIAGTMGTVSGLTEAAGMYFQELQKELDSRGLPINSENVRQIISDEQWLDRTRKRASVKGIVVGGVDAITGGLAAKIGKNIVPKLAKAGLEGKAARGLITREVGKGLATEVVGGAGGEAASQIALGDDLDVKSVALEGIGEILPGVGNIYAGYIGSEGGKQITEAKKIRTEAEKTNTPITSEVKTNSERTSGIGHLIDAYKSNDIEQAKTALADLATVHTPEEFSGMIQVMARIEGLSAEDVQAITAKFEETHAAAQKFNTPELQQDPERTSRAVKTRLDITQAETAETQLEEQKAAADPSLHPKYDEQIQAVREVKADLEETLGAIVAAPKLEVSDDIGFYRTRLDELETTKTTTKNESSAKTQELLELGAVLQDTISSAISEEYGETVVETPAVQKVLYDGVEYEVTKINKDGSFDLSSRDGKFVKAAEKTDAEWQGFVGEPAEATTTPPLPPVKKEKKSSAVTRLEKAAAAIKGSPIAQIESIGALLNIASIPDFIYAKIGDGDISAGKAVVQKAKDLHGEVKAFQSKLAGGKFFSDLDRQIAETRSRIETLEKQSTTRQIPAAETPSATAETRAIRQEPAIGDVTQQTSQVEPDASTTNDTVNEPVSDAVNEGVSEGVTDGVTVSPPDLPEKSLSIEEHEQFLNTGNVPDSALNTIAERLSWIIDNYMGQISDSENSVVYKLLDRMLPKLSTSLSRLTDEKLKNRILDIQYADRPSNTESTLSRIYEAEIKRREVESNLAEETPPVETQKKLEDLAKEVTMKATTASDLYLINRRIWGLTHEQAIETAVIQDRLVAEMARRAGISKTEMYKSLPFTKNPTSIPGNALYQIIGESAKLTRQVLTNLGLAQRQEKLGRTSSFIHNLTGWERASDGKWRYKINFGKLTLTPESLAAMPKNLDGSSVTTLGEIYDAPELFTAYPQLREVEVVFDKKIPPGNGGYDGGIRLSYDQVAKEYQGTSLMSVLVHEIQHVVQDIEGFAQGTSASTVNEREDYINNAGEVEARAAQAMLDLSPEEIRNARLIDLYDVHPDYQIIQFGSDYSSLSPVLPPNEERQQIEAQAKKDGTWMKAPNGKPTNLTEQQWVTVRTNAFKEWFGDFENDPKNASKVVDSNGEPLVVYHGSRFGGITEFKKQMVGRGVVGTNPSGGFYFTNSRENAEYYADAKIIEKEDGKEYTDEDVVVYGDDNARFYHIDGSSISFGPFKTSEEARLAGEAIVEKYNNAKEGDVVFSDEKVIPVFLNIKKPSTADNLTDFRNKEKSVPKDKDGVIGRNIFDGGVPSDIFVLFNSNQIKLADGTNTTFDPNTGDIRFQKDPGLPARGAMAIQSDGIAVMYALTNPNVSTPVHELVHVFERYLTDAEKQTVLAEFGGNEWTTETSEFFARGFERYLLDGVAPTPELQTTFEKFKKWLTDIYLGIRNSVIDTPISVRMENLYASFLTDKEFHNATEKPRVFSTEDKLRGKINQEELDSLRKTIELSDIPPGQTQHIDDMIQESYEKYVTENPLLEGGIYAREEKLAKDALNGLPMDAPMQLALANAINKLRQAHLRETQNLSISKQQGDKKGLIRSISDKIDAIEDQLDMFTRALYKARSVSGRALGIGSKLIDFNAFDEVNMRAKLGERLGESGKTLSEADKAFIKDLSSKINQEVQDIAALDIKDQEAGTKTKMIIAESQISQMKKSKMAKRTQSVLAAKANLDRILKGNIC